MPVVKDDVRKLATAATVGEIRPVEGADKIVSTSVRGWTLVIRKGEFVEGERVIYFEPDTALPIADHRFAFLEARGAKEFDGALYHVLKTAKLRGVFSQGLLMPMEAFRAELEPIFGVKSPADGTDLTAALNLGKWETPLPTGAGEIAGAFDTRFARKTDSERVQNLTDPIVWAAIKAVDWTATEKVDGTSCTVICDETGELRVMGRNWEIRRGDNVYWGVVESFKKLFETLEPGDALQFEIAGPGVQKNGLGLSTIRPFVFDYAKSGVMQGRDAWTPEMLKWAAPERDVIIPDTPEELISSVDKIKSVVTPGRLAEGIVFHTADGRIVPEVGHRNTFKVISNAWLAKNDAR